MDSDAYDKAVEYIVIHPDLVPFWPSEFNLIVVLLLNFVLSGPHRTNFFTLLFSCGTSFCCLFKERLQSHHRLG
tara:strand:- start:1050 stop:1271 length:222 start_codon:yes stop_codon:yes gene_type:complete